MEYKKMNEAEMLGALQNVWQNMTIDKDRDAYGEMLMLLESMVYHLRYDLECTCQYKHDEIKREEFFF